MENKWELITHPAHYQITNGPISLCTREDDADTDEYIMPIVDALNNCPFPLHCENELEFKLHLKVMQLQAELRQEKEQVKVLVDALEKIVHAPVPANEREYMSWFVTAKNVAGGAISDWEAAKEVASYTQGRGGENV